MQENMSILDIINENCPDGVEYKKLGTIGKFYGGITGKSKKDFSNGNAKFITYKNVYDNNAINFNVTDKVKIGKDECQNTLQYCDVCFTGSSETPDECGLSSVVTEIPKENMYLNSFCFFFRFNDTSNVNPLYLKHLFRSQNLREQINKTAQGVIRFNVSKKRMENVIIPLPPLTIQTEIAKILDQFEELEKELEKELKMRIDQYEYYRNMLLSFDDSVEMKKLGEVCNFQNGYAFKSNLFVKKGNPIVRITNIDGHNILMDDVKYFNFNDYKTDLSSFIVNKNDILIALSGATTGKVGQYKSDKPIYINQRVGKFLPNKNQLDNQYLFHVLLMNKEKLFELASGAGAQPNLSSTKLMNKLEIPVPSLEIQESIAETLDQFDELCTSLTNGIPAEIEMRKEQYEYYRNLLLNFKNINEQ